MKKVDRDFHLFKTEFLKRQKQFGLLGCKCYFIHEPVEDAFATITVGNDSATATVRLNSKLDKSDIPFKDPKAHAKHEALHLLTHELMELARKRYISEREIEEAWESLVRKLEVLIT